MSGVELIGIASSILQIADLGWKLSYKLYAFSKKVHEAGKTIELISQDISATGAILKQLGEEVDKDEKAKPDSRLCSQGLIDAAKKLVQECQGIFKDLDLGIGGTDGNKVILGFKQKLKWSYLEPRVELLRANLEGLKSSLALILSVLIYAEQRRSRTVDNALLKEQQNVVASFASQKASTEKKIDQLKKAIEHAPVPDANKASAQASSVSSAHGRQQMPPQSEPLRQASRRTSTARRPHSFQLNAISPQMFLHLQQPQIKSAEPPSSTESPKITLTFLHLEHHRELIEKLLEEVNSSRYTIDHGVRYRLHDGVLDLHWREWAPLRNMHCDDVLRGFLAQSPVLARHWHEQISKVPKNVASPPPSTLPVRPFLVDESQFNEVDTAGDWMNAWAPMGLIGEHKIEERAGIDDASQKSERGGHMGRRGHDGRRGEVRRRGQRGDRREFQGAVAPGRGNNAGAGAPNPATSEPPLFSHASPCLASDFDRMEDSQPESLVASEHSRQSVRGALSRRYAMGMRLDDKWSQRLPVSDAATLHRVGAALNSDPKLTASMRHDVGVVVGKCDVDLVQQQADPLEMNSLGLMNRPSLARRLASPPSFSLPDPVNHDLFADLLVDDVEDPFTELEDEKAEITVAAIANSFLAQWTTVSPATVQ